MKLDDFEFSIDNKGMYVVKKGRRYVRLGGSELRYLFEVLKTGESELPEPLRPVLQAAELSPELKRQLSQKFDEWGFTGDQPAETPEVRRFQLSRIYLFSFNPSKLLEHIPRFLKAWFSLPGIICIFLLAIAKYFLISDHYESIVASVLCYTPSFMELLLILLSLIASLGLHEFAHAMACSYYGGRVSRMGMLLYFFLPAFFCDVSDIYLIAKRKASFCVGIAGVTANVLIGIICTLVYCLTGYAHPIWLYIWFCNVGITFYNLLPIVKLDGYWVLSSLINVNNLMDKSTLLLLAELLKRQEIPKSIPILKRIFLELYGLSIFLIRPAVWVSSGYEIKQLLLRFGCPGTITVILFWLVVAVAVCRRYSWRN